MIYDLYINTQLNNLHLLSISSSTRLRFHCGEPELSISESCLCTISAMECNNDNINPTLWTPDNNNNNNNNK